MDSVYLTLGLIQSTIHVVVMFNVKGKMYILLRHAVAFLHAAYSTVPFFWIACMDRIVLRSFVSA